MLHRIPGTGKIPLIRDREPVPPEAVRDQFQRISFLQECGAEAQSWPSDTVDVLEELGLGPGDEFTLKQAHRYEDVLSGRHPDSGQVRAKDRQQQRGRDSSSSWEAESTVEVASGPARAADAGEQLLKINYFHYTEAPLSR